MESGNRVLSDTIIEMVDSRRTEVRLTTALPVLEVDGARYRVIDFSDHGFRAELPERYRQVGCQGEAIFHLNAAGYAVTKCVAFEAKNVYPEAIGARFDVLETSNKSSGMLF